MTEKEDVLIEVLDPEDPDMVVTHTFDIMSRTITGSSFEVLSKSEVVDFFNIEGEICNGEIRVYEDTDIGEEDDYSEFYDEDKEEEG